MKCDVFDGSIQNALRQPNLFSFVLDKPSVYKVLCEPETFHYKKVNRSVLNIKTFYFEDDDHKEVNFNGNALTFTLKMIKIQYKSLHTIILSYVHLYEYLYLFV